MPESNPEKGAMRSWANGLHPRHYDEVLGRRAARNLNRGSPLSWDCLTDSD